MCWQRCEIVDKHLGALSVKHIEVRRLRAAWLCRVVW
jgi:hypothetical protein